jgi:putative spermidine/putrescine transport system permease protein
LASAPRVWTTEGQATLALPLGALFAVFFLAPLALLAGVSVFRGPAITDIGLDQYAAFVSDRANVEILWDTLLLGVHVTLLTLLLGFPLAWLMTRVSDRLYTVLVFVTILPLLTSVVVRTFAWIVILGRQGIVNTTLIGLGSIDAPLGLLYSRGGVVVALAQVMMPMMVLPISSVLRRIDPGLEQASLALGAGYWRTLVRINVPLAMPGIIAGCLLTFAGAVTAFITQTLIGGGRIIYVPYLIYQHGLVLQNWKFAAAISIIFAAAVLCVVWAINLLGRPARGSVAA